MAFDSHIKMPFPYAEEDILYWINLGINLNATGPAHFPTPYNNDTNYIDSTILDDIIHSTFTPRSITYQGGTTDYKWWGHFSYHPLMNILLENEAACAHNVDNRTGLQDYYATYFTPVHICSTYGNASLISIDDPLKASPIGSALPPRCCARNCSITAKKDMRFSGRAKPCPSSG